MPVRRNGRGTGSRSSSWKHIYPCYPAKWFADTPCRPDFLRSWHNHFDNYGNFMPGYCGGISLGSWFELDRLLEEGIDPEDRPVLKYLINDDMQGLLNLALDMGYQEPPEGYVSKCHLCLNIRQYLVSKGDFEELQPRAFYEQLS